MKDEVRENLCALSYDGYPGSYQLSAKINLRVTMSPLPSDKCSFHARCGSL